MKGYNLPDNVSPNDPEAPWNQEEQGQEEPQLTPLEELIVSFDELLDHAEWMGTPPGYSWSDFAGMFERAKKARKRIDEEGEKDET